MSRSDRDHGEEIAERLMRQGVPARTTRFFGGVGLAKDGLQFGFVNDGTLYLRVDDDSRPAYEAKGASPFEYRARDKTVTVASYFEAPVDILDDDDELAGWASRAIDAAAKGAEGKRRS